MKRAGAVYTQHKGCDFTVWAPEKEQVQLHIVFPEERRMPMQKDEEGYFHTSADGVMPGARYFFSVNGKDFPDPASAYQPEGVHGPSEVVDHDAWKWSDQQWRVPPFRDLVMYELHVGAFTPEGTFEAMLPYLGELAATGINAIELMPVNQFPGNRNWGYDGVYPYAVQHSYGGPQAMKQFVDACHQHGIAVFLDVIYNHIGPEGSYLSQYAPYFSGAYSTPWGDAVNFDGPWSDGVKAFFTDNIVYWLEYYHIDGVRLDAIHYIFDHNAVNFWDIAYQKVRNLETQLGRKYYMIAESDYNSPRVVKHPDAGGLGLDATWLDDFHHALYVLLHPEGKARYEDYGTMEQLAKAYTDGFVHSGEYVKARKRRHGASSAGLPGDRFVAFNQNHDQVGNRPAGERLSVLVDFERLKLAAGALFLSPYIPMLFMGEEYGEDNPFFYFVDHSDEHLIRSVQEGRRKEFEEMLPPDAAFPDPQSPDTFKRSKLNWEKRRSGRHRIMLEWYSALIQLRRSNKVLQCLEKDSIRIDLLGENGFVIHRRCADTRQHLLCLFNLSDTALGYTMPPYQQEWQLVLDSGEEKWMGDATPGRQPSPARTCANSEMVMPPCSLLVYG
jgi:maltooligosyltrehalose trehalohydrolase